MGGWQLGHRPALDGIRAIAVVVVIAHHAELVPAGYIGVDMFFALSGFLITSMLLEEHERTGRVNLPDFWHRRARRLLPALLLIVAAVGGLGAAGAGQYWVTPGAIVAAVTFTMNWFLFSGTVTALTHTWSLAIEEQFYLSWPIVLYVALRRGGQRYVLASAGTLAVAFTLWALTLRGWASPAHLVFGLDARISPILVGCALSAFMHRRNVKPSPLWVAPLALVTLSGLVAGVVSSGLTGITTALLIWSVTSRRSFRPLEGRVVQWIGVRSYAIYLWHAPILFVLSSATGWHPSLVFIVGSTATAAAAGASYVFVECPLRKSSPGKIQRHPQEVAGTPLSTYW